MELNKFLNKTDIQLYQSILKKIYKDFDNIEPSVLGDLLDKLKELHDELDNIVKQRRTQQMYNTPYYKNLDILKRKEDEKERERMKNKEDWFNECIKKEPILLKDIYTLIGNKSK